MIDLSEWAWLIVVVLWVVVKAVARLFRGKTSSEIQPKPAPRAAGPASGTPMRTGDIAPKPIEPR